MQYDPVIAVFISALCTLEDMGMVIILICKGQITWLWLLWLGVCLAWKGEHWPQLPCAPTTACSPWLLSLAPLQSTDQVHMSYIYTSTEMVIFISQLLPEAWTQPPAPGWHSLPYCQHSQRQVWKSGKMSWKHCFFHMHSCCTCSSNVLKTFSFSKCILTYLHFRFMLLPIHFTFCITPNGYFNCWYLDLTRTVGKWGEGRN